MPDRSEISYFGAGPAGLPTSVLETAAKSLVNHYDTGLGLAEHSHRSALASGILDDTKKHLAAYLDIPDDYDILFMQGGGSGEFSATVYNFVGFWVEKRRLEIVKALGTDDEAAVTAALKKAVEEEFKVDYLVTGSWSLKASQEAARLLGAEYVNVAADSRTTNNGKFGGIPEESSWALSKAPAFTYFCDNETVDGVEFPAFPAAIDDGRIVVADMSSNILSRRIPVSKYAAIFFGAQKNLGTAGITVVVIRKNLLPPSLATPSAKLMRQLGLPIPPIVLDYGTIAKNNSLYNTLSVFEVYIADLVLQLLLTTYPDNKVDGQQVVSEQKAKTIYSALEAHPQVYEVCPP